MSDNSNLAEVIEELTDTRIELDQLDETDDLGQAIVRLARAYRDTPDDSLQKPTLGNAVTEAVDALSEREEDGG